MCACCISMPRSAESMNSCLRHRRVNAVAGQQDSSVLGSELRKCNMHRGRPAKILCMRRRACPQGATPLRPVVGCNRGFGSAPRGCRDREDCQTGEAEGAHADSRFELGPCSASTAGTTAEVRRCIRSFERAGSYCWQSGRVRPWDGPMGRRANERDQPRVLLPGVMKVRVGEDRCAVGVKAEAERKPRRRQPPRRRQALELLAGQTNSSRNRL